MQNVFDSIDRAIFRQNDFDFPYGAQAWQNVLMINLLDEIAIEDICIGFDGRKLVQECHKGVKAFLINSLYQVRAIFGL